MTASLPSVVAASALIVPRAPRNQPHRADVHQRLPRRRAGRRNRAQPRATAGHSHEGGRHSPGRSCGSRSPTPRGSTRRYAMRSISDVALADGGGSHHKGRGNRAGGRARHRRDRSAGFCDGLSSISAGSSDGCPRLELAAGAGVEVDVRRDERDERERQRVDDAGDDVERARTACREEDQHHAEQRARRSARPRR